MHLGMVKTYVTWIIWTILLHELNGDYMNYIDMN